MAVTTLKPDIVIIDKQAKKAKIFELTVPAEHRLKTSHDLKYQKYCHFQVNSNYSVEIIPFEIGSNTVYISSDNKTYLHSLHKFCNKSIKLKKFYQNISAIAVLSSYYIFNCRSYEMWEDMEPIQAPFNNQ